MRQKIRGVFASITGLPAMVERARRQLGLTWTELAEGSPWSRQYLQAHLQGDVLQGDVVEHLVSRLNLQPAITLTSKLIPTTAAT